MDPLAKEATRTAAGCTAMNDLSALWNTGTFEIMSLCRKRVTSRRRCEGMVDRIADSSKMDWRLQ